jgi:hypothetical protein
VRLQLGGGEALYRDSLQAATIPSLLFGFRKTGGLAVSLLNLPCKIARKPIYGLHIELPPQLVAVPLPPSARTTVGITKVLRNSTAAPKTSSTRFTVVISL